MKIIFPIVVLFVCQCITSYAQDKNQLIDYRNPKAHYSTTLQYKFFINIDAKKLLEVEQLEKQHVKDVEKIRTDLNLDERKKQYTILKTASEKNNKLSKILSPAEFRAYMQFIPHPSVPWPEPKKDTKP